MTTARYGSANPADNVAGFDRRYIMSQDFNFFTRCGDLPRFLVTQARDPQPATGVAGLERKCLSADIQRRLLLTWFKQSRKEVRARSRHAASTCRFQSTHVQTSLIR